MITDRAWIEINTQQLTSNINAIKRILPESTTFALVVKANAYGHGMELVSAYCEQQQLVDFFCVAHLSEALQLRNSGITLPILVMCTIDTSIHDAIMQEIDISVSSFENLHTINAATQSLQKKAHIHIKIDTGLSRFGFFPQQIAQLITILQASEYLIICGIYSHFAQSQNSDLTYTEQQKNIFKTVVNQFFAAGIQPIYIHQQNSAGVVTQPDLLYNMIRIGALAYGMWSSNLQQSLFERITKQTIIKPILSFKTHIIELKTVAPQTPIGYNGTFITQRPTKIAIIPVGYADGYMRNYGTQKQSAFVYVNNIQAPIIGHIAMNTIIIDVTNITSVAIGDVVILIGLNQPITPNDLARILHNGNPREVTVSLNPHILRITA